MRKLLFTFLALILLVSFLLAVPAMPGFRQFTQPDGSKIILELKGDEHFHFAETPEGYSVVRDNEGWWTYAQKVDGLLVPTMFIVGKDNCPFPKRLRPDVDAVAALPVNRYRQINWKDFADIDIYSKDGRADTAIIVILGAFDDSTYFGTTRPANWDVNYWGVKTGFTSAAEPGGTAHDSVYWDSVFFSMPGPSFKSYYAELSFGTWICDGIVLGPLSSGGTYGEYGDGAELTYMTDVAWAAGGRLQLIGKTYTDFDSDGDGYVDHWLTVRCGGEQAATGDPADMWATKYTTTISTSWAVSILNPTNAGELTAQDITSDPTLDTLYVRSRTMGIGVFAHESFHAFGAPDLYDYGYEGTTAGDWSLMDGGSWTSDGIQSGSRPAHPGAMLQYDIPGAPETTTPDGFFFAGWRQEINTNGRYPIVGLGLPASYGGPRLYLAQNSNFAGIAEYFLIENRCNYGVFEGNLPEHGLIISHYDPSEKGTRYNEGPGTATYYTYWIEQMGFDPQIHVDYSTDTIYRDVGGAAYMAGAADNEFTNLTSAGTNSNDLSVDGPHIISISAPGDTMWFTLDNAAVPATASFAFIDLTVYDTITNYGNNNGLANPDEMFDMVINLKNVGANASSVAGILRNIDGKASVIDSNGTWGTINSGTSALNSSDAFRVKLNPGYGSGEYVKFNLAVTSSNGATDIEVVILINTWRITDHFNLRDINTVMTDPTAIDVVYNSVYGWLMFANGTGLGNIYGTGSNVITYFDIASRGVDVWYSSTVSGLTYIYAIDHEEATQYIWYSNGDYVYCYDFSTGSPVEIGSVLWHNTDYAASPPIRVRGITFDNNDSLYGYWQTYDQLIESIFGETKNLGGTGSEWWGVPLTDGEGYGGLWNNGRGIEWDGNAFWSVCLWKNKIYRRDSNFNKFYTTNSPSVFGSYPAYDLAWQPVGPAGDDAVQPYKPGNRYYLWTVNLDNSEVFQMDMTDIVLPTAVSNLTATLLSDRVTLTWDANPTYDMVDHYIVYRSTDSLYYPDSADSIGTTTTTTYDDFSVSKSKATYYYKVRAVNYHGYSTSTSFDAAAITTTLNILTANLTAEQINADVKLAWNAVGEDGTKWNIYRALEGANYELIGNVDIKDNANEYKFIDNKISKNGIYNYKIELVKNNNMKIAFDEIKFKYFNNLVFGIAPLNQNPIRGDIVLKYSLDRNGETELILYNITGQAISTPVKGIKQAGLYSVKINSNTLPAGTYFAVLRQGNKESIKRFMLIK